MKAPLLLLAMLVGFFDHAMNDWGASIFPSAVAMTLPIFYYRRLWNQGRFWVAAALLGALQVPFIIAVRPMIEQARSKNMLVFTIADLVVVVVAITLVCPTSSRESK